MKDIATTRMSSKGQVVIPESIRQSMGLTAGEQFVVVGRGDVVILKTLTVPDMKDFNRLVREARQNARKAGLTRQDVAKAIQRVRRIR